MKADQKELDHFKKHITHELKKLSKPSQISWDKDLKALENRLMLKVSKAITRMGDLLKKQERKVREVSESRLL